MVKEFLKSQAAALVGVVLGILVFAAVGYATGWWGALARAIGWWIWIALFILLAVAILVAMLWLLPRYRERRFLDQLRSEDAKAPQDEVEENRRQLREKMREAIRTLENSPDLKKRPGLPLYALPWFPLIGASPSGKTTLLQGVANLFSPFVRPSSTAAIPTPNCDWWFFNTAIILDISGRYAFPSGQASDGSEWYRLLQLLRYYREREPISGLLIAVAADELASKRPEELRLAAVELRKRVDEAIRELGVDFPIYLLITRCDLIEGFTEFFGGLPEHTQRQVFGFVNETRPVEGDQQPRATATVSYESIFASMVERLQQLRLSLLREKPPSAALRHKIFCFPEEFQALQPSLRTVVETLFAQNPYQHTPFWRGIFFCSAQQQGTPVSSLRRELHFEAQIKPLEGGSKNIFLYDLFSTILPRDRYLVKPTVKASRAKRLKDLLGFSACLGLCILLALFLTRAFLSDRRIYSSADASRCNRTVEGVATTPLLDQVDGCRQVVQTLIDQRRQRPSWGKLQFDRSGHLEEELRRRYVEKFEAEVLTPLDTAIASHLAGESAQVPFVLLWLQRIELIKRCLSPTGCPAPVEKEMRPDYQLMWAGARQQPAPATHVAKLQNAYEAYLRWPVEPKEALRREQASNAGRLRQWFAATQNARPQILLWANHDYPPVTSQESWELPQTAGGEKASQVGGAYTRLAWERGVRPLLQRTRDAVPDVEPFVRILQGAYRAQYLEEWRRFLEGFPQGEVLWGRSPEQRHRLALRLLDEQSPYNRMIDVAFEHVKPLPGEVPAPVASLTSEPSRSGGKDAQESGSKDADATVPAWVRFLQGYVGSESRNAYLESLKETGKQLGGDSPRESSFQLAKAGFQEGKPAEKSPHPLLKAWWLLGRFREQEGSGSESEGSPFWTLVQRPVLFVWRVILEEAGVYLQERWNDLLLEVKDLSVSQKQEVLYGKEGKVAAFVAGPAAAFLERRGDQFTRRRVLDAEVAFMNTFLSYLKESRVGWASPEIEEAKRRVQVAVAPASIDGDANLKVVKTELILDCDTGKQVLDTPNAVADFTFTWTAKSCFNTIVRVHLADASGQGLGSLERRYPTLAQFLAAFKSASRVFRISELTAESEAQLVPYRNRVMTLRYRISEEDRQQVIKDLEARKLHEKSIQARVDLPAKIVATPQ